MKIDQMKFQKWVVIGAFIVACLTFVYAYSFATPFYQLSQDTAQNHLNDVGKNFFANIQPFNRQLAAFSIVFIVLSLMLFISMSQKRRRYYVLNYVAAGVYAVGGLLYSVFSIINIIKLSGEYAKINFNEVIDAMREEIEYAREALKPALQQELDRFLSDVPTSTPVFAIGIVLFSLVLVAAGLLIFNCVRKKKIMDAEDKEFAEEDAAIRAAQAEHARRLAEDM